MLEIQRTLRRKRRTKSGRSATSSVIIDDEEYSQGKAPATPSEVGYPQGTWSTAAAASSTLLGDANAIFSNRRLLSCAPVFRVMMLGLMLPLRATILLGCRRGNLTQLGVTLQPVSPILLITYPFRHRQLPWCLSLRRCRTSEGERSLSIRSRISQ